MTIVNIRGTSGSGKSTLVHRFLKEYPNEPVYKRLGNWKKPRIVAYKVDYPSPRQTIVVGKYATKCGGCDSMSYKGSHDDIENLVRGASLYGNVIYEGLTISSTITRWLTISEEIPGEFVWAFMSTSEDKCYKRILARSGREPKRNKKGLADYNIKYRSCLTQKNRLIGLGEQVINLSSDTRGYKKLLEALNAPPSS